MLHGSETWLVNKKNRWTTGRVALVNNRLTCKCNDLRERLGTDDITTVVQQYSLRWYNWKWKVSTLEVGQRKLGVKL